MANTVDIGTSLTQNGIPLTFNYDTTLGTSYQLIAAQTLQYYLLNSACLTPIADGVVEFLSGTTVIRKYNVKAGISSGFLGSIGAVYPVVKVGESFSIRCNVALFGDIGLVGVPA